MKLEMSSFQAVAANLPVEGEVCDIGYMTLSTQPQAETEIAPLIEKVGATSIAEIDRLIAELQQAKGRLQSERARIEREAISYVTLTQMASASAKIIFDAVSRWHPARNQKKQMLPKSQPLRPRTTSVHSGKVIITASGTPPNSVRRLMEHKPLKQFQHLEALTPWVDTCVHRGCGPRRSRRTRHDCGAPAASGCTIRRPARALGCLWGTFSPSRRQIRSTRLLLIVQPAWRSSSAILR